MKKFEQNIKGFIFYHTQAKHESCKNSWIAFLHKDTQWINNLSFQDLNTPGGIDTPSRKEQMF